MPDFFSDTFSGVAGAVSAALVVVAVFAWLGRVHSVFELVANARFQILLLAIFAAFVMVLLRQGMPALIVAGVVIIHGLYMAPYMSANADVPVADVDTVAVMQYNIYFKNTNYDAIAKQVIGSDAEVVALHELLPEQWEPLRALLVETYPYHYAVPVSEADAIGPASGGMAFVSKNPLVPIELDPKYSRPDRPLLAAETTLAGEPVVVVGLHPEANRFVQRKVEQRNEQLEGVASFAAEQNLPVIVFTDMNMTPHSSDYQKFVNDLGWRDPHKVAGWNSTWPSFMGPLGFPIDHIFVSNEFYLHDYSVGQAAGSDHRSLTAEVSLGRQPGSQN